MSDIPNLEDATLALYADDTTVICQHSNIDQAVENLQISVDILVNWFLQWRFKLNSTKCETKIFSLRKYTQPHDIHIQGVFVPWNEDDRGVKYLGVWLDKKLNWNLHVNKKLTEGYARLAKLFPLINRKSSLKPTCSVLIYKTIIRPLILYASPVWGLAVSKSKLNKIQVLQNKILRIAVNAPWFIRNKHLHDELGVSSISDFVKCGALKFLNSVNFVPGAITYNIGQPSLNLRLSARLPQDILEIVDG
jgi:hypothetical protein